MSINNLVALYLSTKIKTSVLKGILAENKFKKNLENKFIEDIMVLNNEDFSRTILLFNNEDLKDDLLIEIENLMTPLNNKIDVFLILIQDGKPIIRKKYEEFRSITNLDLEKSIIEKGASVNTIQLKENQEIINNMSDDDLEEFVKRQTIATYSSAFFNFKWKINIDILTYDQNGIIDVYEIKKRSANSLNYLNKINAGEYKVLRDIQQKLKKNIKFYNKFGDEEWIEYKIDFFSDDELKYEKNIFYASASTSFSGNKNQKMYLLKEMEKVD